MQQIRWFMGHSYQNKKEKFQTDDNKTFTKSEHDCQKRQNKIRTSGALTHMGIQSTTEHISSSNKKGQLHHMAQY
eukprot:11909918-Ditylum_brightwellii.AAC.1